MEGQGSTPAPVAPTQVTPTPAFTPIAVNKRFAFGAGPLAAVVAGAVLAGIGTALKGFSIPSDVIYGGSTSFASANGGKLVIGAAVIALVFLAIARGTHRKGILWGTYVFSAIGLAIAAIDAGGGFTISLTDGSTRHSNAAIGVFVALVGCALMLAAAIATRQTAKPLGDG